MTCLCAGGLAPADCDDLPPSLAARLRRVCRVVNRAIGSSRSRGRAAPRPAPRPRDPAVTAAQSRGAIDDVCGTALGARLADTRARAAAMRAAL